MSAEPPTSQEPPMSQEPPAPQEPPTQAPRRPGLPSRPDPQEPPTQAPGRPGLPSRPVPLPRPTTDAHTHLSTTTRKTGLDASALIEAARAVGVRRLVDVGYDPASSRDAVTAAQQHPEVVAAVAVHPHDAVELGDALDEALRSIEAMLGTTDRIRAVGETGLDYYWVRDEAGRARQRESFAAQIALAKGAGLALVVHDRDAHADLADVLDGEGWPDRVQLHCFSGDAAFARRCLSAGAYLSFPGTVTFKPNADLRDALRIAPADRILVETDAPYLTPVPLRGRVNASYLLPHTVAFMAQVRGVDVGELCEQLDANATALFGDWGAA